MSISSLPTEILSLIASFAGRDELKALRLTNHDLGKSATTILFREIHISPNSHSFDRAGSVAAEPGLRRHVKSLVYHFGMLGDYYAGFDAFKYEYFAMRKPGESRDPTEVTSEVLWCYSCWLEELDSQRTFELQDEQQELCNLCDQLFNLEEVTALLDDVDDIANPQGYIGQRTGMAASENDGECRFMKLMCAVKPQNLSKLSARSISWRDLDRFHQDTESATSTLGSHVSEHTITLPKNLRQLELGLYNPLHLESLDEIDSRCGWLTSWLSELPFLNALRLDFDELPFESHVDVMLPISATIFTHRWQRLTELMLVAIAAHEEDLIQFLIRHNATLRSLQLSDIELVKITGETQVPSVPRLFRSIHGCLRLNKCKITGNFTNRIDQAWYVDTEFQFQDSLRGRLERYMCGGSDIVVPASSLQLPLVDSGTAKDSLFDRYVRHENVDSAEWIAFCDESWYWCPELLETTN